MRKIGFIGAYDKIDLIMYVSKILTELGKKVLVIDATEQEKARYIIPTINPAFTYITEYEGIDVAIGFKNEEDIKRYLGMSKEEEYEYDFGLINVDTEEEVTEFKMNENEKNYFATSFDVYTIKKGLQALSGLETAITLTKILYSQNMLKDEDDYLNYIAKNYKIVWKEIPIFFPIENGDLTVIQENQRLEKIKFKKLSIQYKEGLIYLATEILGETSDNKARRVIKMMEKGV